MIDYKPPPSPGVLLASALKLRARVEDTLEVERQRLLRARALTTNPVSALSGGRRAWLQAVSGRASKTVLAVEKALKSIPGTHAILATPTPGLERHVQESFRLALGEPTISH